MQQVVIDTTNCLDLLRSINKILKGNIINKYGEFILHFNNSVGNGTIRGLDLDWGISNLSYKLNLNQRILKSFKTTETNFTHFIFISEGNLNLHINNNESIKSLQRLQNIIFTPNKNINTGIEFPENTVIEFNVIYINTDNFKNKKNNNLKYLNPKLFYYLNNNTPKPFIHLGNYSLKIAELVNELTFNTYKTGIVRSLQTEGIITLILAQQVLEFNNYENHVYLPDSLTSGDIEIIYELTKYIHEHISDPITIEILCRESGLHPKKLQAGFQLLFSKTVNEYTRDVKLKIASDYLINTDYSISEIVYNIGLKSRSYFSKIFYEQYGLLPIEYRKNQKN